MLSSVQEALEPDSEMKKENKTNSLLTTVLLQALNAKVSSSESEIWIASVIEAVKRNLPELATKYHSVQTAFPVSVGVDFPIAAK